MGYSSVFGKGGFYLPFQSALPAINFDVNFAQKARFALQNVGGINYIDSYTHNGYSIIKAPSVTSTARAILDDTQGINFQNNNLSYLFSGTDIPHKEIWIIFNCLQGATYKATDGNPIYVNRNTSTIPLLRGDASTSRVSQFSFGASSFGQISNTTWTGFTNLGLTNNANPINSFRVLYMSFPNLTRQVFYLGAGSTSGGSLILRPLNGYIKRAICFAETLTLAQRADYLAQLKAEYAI